MYMQQAEVPDGLLLPLRQHQLQSLAWMQVGRSEIFAFASLHGLDMASKLSKHRHVKPEANLCCWVPAESNLDVQIAPSLLSRRGVGNSGVSAANRFLPAVQPPHAAQQILVEVGRNWCLLWRMNRFVSSDFTLEVTVQRLTYA